MSFFAALAPTALADADVIYVDAHATGPVFDGSSWCSGYRRLDDAIAKAGPGTSIRVAQGVYKPRPDLRGDPGFELFWLYGGVSWEGGYAGCTAEHPDDREVDVFTTVLSCDHADNDGPNFANRDDNCFAIVAAVDGTGTPSGIDGFTFQGATARALTIRDGVVTIRHCAFLDHQDSDLAGAVSIELADVTFESCRFQGNHGRLGGAVNIWLSDVEFTDCLFEDNAAVGDRIRTPRGGAIYNEGGAVAINSCTFRRNNATDFGGAVFSIASVIRQGKIECRNTVFEENSAYSGGGLWMEYASPGTQMRMRNCLFARNVAAEQGAAIQHQSGWVLLSHCTIGENRLRTSYGAGLWGGQFSNTTIEFSTLWDNGTPLHHTDLSAQITANYRASYSVHHSCVAGWDPQIGYRNTSADPLFAYGPLGCYYLSQIGAGQAKESPCVDGGYFLALSSGLGDTTTRSDEEADQGTADIGYHYAITGNKLIRGDVTRDGRLDLRDVLDLQQCFTGRPTRPATACCRIFDFTGDTGVDRSDWKALAAAINGP